MGINSWSGKRFNWPAQLADEEVKRVVTPFKNHYYFNVVTFGYTTAYWDWERWSKEIDWMALHGIDMPLALVANEAISARVWKKLGLTDEEISNYFVGPAHFPWMRMGNISGVDGPLPQEWHADQVALQHKILDKMKSLGMRPICPGFAGFVPKEMTRIYPDLKLFETSWSGGAFHNWMVSPEQPLFKEIGRMFIEEWEKEFGKNEHYIVDSFNEMDIPFPPKGTPERYTLLAGYGEKVYESIKAGNPDAVWVMQGWMFGYQRHIWDYETLEALVSKVPNDKMILLDLAADYNALFWKNTPNWEFYKGLYGKEWVYSVIPNMGGKVGMTGDLEFYANGRLNALNSPNKGNLTGYGMAPEGIENNEVIYELITDAGWASDKIDVNAWLKNYSINRYGSAPDSIITYWNKMRESVYGTFTDHPRYNWQFRPGNVGKGSINANQSFFEGIESFASVSETLKDSPLYNVDLIELTAQYVGAKMELLLINISKAYEKKDIKLANQMQEQFEELALGVDKILYSHPNLRLENWIGFARKHGSNDELKNYYEKNARRLVTIWGPPVDDYSARIWSGLIRDYYLPRWKHYFNEKSSGSKFDYAAWEREWVEKKLGLSEVKPYENVSEACVNLINKAKEIK
jgi:Alpha-N-acetylglucosaminidase (NAGLU).